MVNRLIRWLGPARSRFIFALLAGTGALSLMLNAVRPAPAWIPLVQTSLAVIFLLGAALTIISRFDGLERRQILIVVGPALLALIVGIFVPQIFVGAVVVAVGWMAIVLIVGRSGIRREYQRAIKAMRKGDYTTAISVMDELIKAEAENADHRRFRAELYRLSGNLKRARTDYKKVTELMPNSGVGFNGLAEVYLQDGEYAEAREFGLKALALEPNEWVPSYNLGMIEDRLGLWTEALAHLQQSIEARIPDRRHRLLAQLWRTRALINTGDEDGANVALEALKAEKNGLREWKLIFGAAQAATLRGVLEADVDLAEKLISGEVALETLRRSSQANNA